MHHRVDRSLRQRVVVDFVALLEDLRGYTGCLARMSDAMNVQWVDDFVFNNSGLPNTVSSYAELGGRVGWRPTRRLEVSVVAQNLLHDQHLEYVISSPNPREDIMRTVTARAAVRW